jgi:hypothetical protein
MQRQLCGYDHGTWGLAIDGPGRGLNPGRAVGIVGLGLHSAT